MHEKPVRLNKPIDSGVFVLLDGEPDPSEQALNLNLLVFPFLPVSRQPRRSMLYIVA